MKPLARLSVIAGFAGLTLVPSLADAHVRLVYPTPRYPSPTGADDSSNIKQQPCGRTGDARTTDASRVTVLEPGATITVQFNETINHPGFFRISFDDDGQNAFVAPTTRAMVQTAPPFTLPTLLDNIADKNGGAYTAMVTLPNVECERCTLQLIQVMVNATAMTWLADGADPDIYYTCADITLRRTGGTGGMGGMGPTAGAGGVGGGAVAGAGGVATGGSGGLGGSGGPGAGSGGLATGGSATGGVATGGSATGGVASGGVPSGGSAGMPSTGGTTPGGGAPSGGGTTAGTTSDPTTDEEGGCRMAPPSRGSHAFLAAAVAALVVSVRRRRGSRPFAA
jgi:hypothetical protein